MAKYKNKTILPAGVELDGILTLNPEILSEEEFKVHLIQWADKQNRQINIDDITITEYDEGWQNKLESNKHNFSITIQSNQTDGVLKLDEGNIGFSIQYKPFVTGEEYTLYFIVTIKISGEEPFDIAFSSFIKGGDTVTGHGDVNITAKSS
ncbi:MAG: hypothetical protein IPK18_02965 [Sphingobacteriales bacterium]|nr:MAG: hypothetical protein IPK18_02965 [Sphingobacteriales bacterium]